MALQPGARPSPWARLWELSSAAVLKSTASAAQEGGCG